MARIKVGKRAKKLIAFRIKPELKELISVRAAEEGLTITEFIEQAIEIKLSLPTKFILEINKITHEIRKEIILQKLMGNKHD